MGTDTTGKVFSEETKTVVLSRHGAGIVSRYRFAPDEILALRLPGSNQEAEMRLVGQIGGEPGRYIYGMAFVDPNLQFWPMDFPPSDSFEPASRRLALECKLCGGRQDIEQGEIEEDVYSVNGNILRYCERCGTTTPWEKARGEANPAPASNPQPPPARLPGPAGNSANPVEAAFGSPASSVAAPPEPAYAGSRLLDLVGSDSPSSAKSPSPALAESFASQTVHSTPTATVELHSDEPAATPRVQSALNAPDIRTQAVGSNGKRVNRRRHMRIRVNFNACVRHPAHGDEIVECENMSKGGICFHSRKQYSVDSLIEIAAPFSPGQPTLFVPAQIKRVEALPGSQIFRYGVAYLPPSCKAPSF